MAHYYLFPELNSDYDLFDEEYADEEPLRCEADLTFGEVCLTPLVWKIGVEKTFENGVCPNSTNHYRGDEGFLGAALATVLALVCLVVLLVWFFMVLGNLGWFGVLGVAVYGDHLIRKHRRTKTVAPVKKPERLF